MNEPIQRRFAAEDLRVIATGILTAAGVPEADAQLVADTLIQAELWGHSSHGLMRLPAYLARIHAGLIRPVFVARFSPSDTATGLLDGRDGLGQVVAAHAMAEAVRRAKVHGISAISVRDSNHFGVAMYFTRMVANEGQIGILISNASPAMPPWGGRQKIVGTNPWSIAAPAGRHAPLLLDIANTVVARGKVMLAKQRGVAIPEGWAVDAEGRATTDPIAALAGMILPMGGHKGYAVAVMMDVLAGVLSGSAFGAAVGGPYQAEQRSRCGHLAIALDVGCFMPLQEFCQRAEQLIEELKSASKAPGVSEIYYPGEREALEERRRLERGIEVPEATLRALSAILRDSAPQLLPLLSSEPGGQASK